MSPARRALGRGIALAIALAAVACELAVDVGPYQQACPAHQKACPNIDTGKMSCVNVSNEYYGCLPQGCVSCYSAPMNNAASYACPTTGGACQVEACNPGFADCVGDLKSCQTNLNTNPSHCGSCDHDCTAAGFAPQAGTHYLTTGCVAGNCKVTQCEVGWADCDGATTNGCELMLAGATGPCCPDRGACPASGCQPCAAGKTCDVTNPIRVICK